MKQNKTKRILAGCLAVVMAASALWGCSPSGQIHETETTKESSSGKEPDSGQTAMGRYVESKIPMPENIADEWVLDMTQNPDGSFELYTESLEEVPVYAFYRFDGTAWEKQEDSWITALPAGASVANVVYAADGTCFCIYLDADYQSHLAKVSEDKTMTEIPVEGLEGERTNRLQITGNGLILIPLMGEKTLAVDESGVLQYEIPQRFNWSDYCDSQTLTKDSYVTTGDQGFVRYGLDGKEKETIPYQTGEDDINGSLMAGTGNDFYLCNAQGIHHMSENGTIWETVVDGSLNSLGMPSVCIKRLFSGNDQDFYVWYTDSSVSSLVHYAYDKEIPSVPTTELTVYGLDLSENKTIRQAASLFQTEHPEVRVEVIDGNGGAGGTTVSDTIRALNTELLNGNGADILILDGLPVDSYIEKGILADMKEVISPMMNTGELYEQIAEAFTGEDGAIYQFPPRVVWPAAYGGSEVVDSIKSLDSINRYQTKYPDHALIHEGTIYENILWQFLHLYYRELVDQKTGKLVEERLQKLLETVKLVGIASGSKVKNEKSDMNGYGEEYNTIDKNAFSAIDAYSLYTDNTVLGVELAAGMMDFALPISVVNQRNKEGKTMVLQTIDGMYYPKGLLGVTSQSKAKDTAMEFVQFVLSETVQESDLSDGWPVNKKGAEGWQKRELPYSVGLSSPETGLHLYGEYPKEEERRMILGMLNELSVPVFEDQVLMEMIVNETRGYFDGRQTAEEAAAAAVSKAGLYEAE